MNQSNLKLIGIAGLAMGAIFGASGSLVAGPVAQILLYQISSLGLTVGCLTLGVLFLRKNEDILCIGFLTLAIAEAVMSGGTANGEIGGQASFGAGMALYVPALWLVSSAGKLPLIPRISGLAASIPFAIAATKIFMGIQVLSSAALPGIGYGLLVLTIIGWIWSIMKEKI